MTSNKFKISIVMAIYNVEEYIEEAIESVIKQDLDFSRNIELILINDGSPDNCEEICLRYQNIYPNNIVYFKQINKGVSAARNKGIELATGDYINFCDPDDTLDLDVCRKVLDLFEKYKEQDYDFCALRIKYGGVQTGYHLLDYKFEGRETIDLTKDVTSIQMHCASTFIKSSIIKCYRFDEKLKYGEDSKLINSILIQNPKYLVLNASCYNYRKRETKDSAQDTSKTDINWFMKSLEKLNVYLIEESIKNYGKVPEFIQHTVMYNLQWKIKFKNIDNTLTKRQKVEYMYLINKILLHIDDEIILLQQRLKDCHKKYSLDLKYDTSFNSDSKTRSKYKAIVKLCTDQLKELCNVNILEINNNSLFIEGTLSHFISKDTYDFYIEDNNGKKYKPSFYEFNNDNILGLENTKIFESIGFKIAIPLNNIKSFNFIYKDKTKVAITPIFGKFAKLSNLKSSYYKKGSYILEFNNESLLVNKNTFFKRISSEFKFSKTLLKNFKFNMITYRFCYNLSNLFLKKPIWIISDRIKEAKDNGIALYDYILKQNNNSINTYFAISTKCSDAKKIKEYGKVINFNSFKHKLLQLLSTNVISSQGDDFVCNLFRDNYMYLKDLHNFNFIFLQHGVIHSDLSKWLFKQNKNIKLFVTTSEGEYKSVQTDKYAYNESQVKLTGMPRYDLLENKPKKEIVILPTWRMNLLKTFNYKTMERSYSEDFKNSDYCKYYNALLNDELLNKLLEKFNYTLHFYVHPAAIKQAKDFKSTSKHVILHEENANYKEVFRDSSLLITDYSSVFFDFAYLNKPVIYTQFDKDEFLQSHIYGENSEQVYFEHEKDGFGPVAYDIDQTIKEIIKLIKKDCKISPEYQERIDKFFTYKDKDNTKRVYEEILKLGK